MAILLTLLLLAVSDESAVMAKLKSGTGVVELPAGVVEVSREIELPAGAHDLTIRGAKEGTVLRAATTFQGRAIFVSRGGRRLRFEHFEMAGSREAVGKPEGLPPSDVPFAKFTGNNGILVDGGKDVTVSDVTMREIAGFAVLVTASSQVRIERVSVEDSGSQNAKGRNNATGGILLEEGTTDFAVLRCSVKNVSGNGIWTHSLYKSPRNAWGRIADNRISDVARDAIQVGHATEITVEDNTGERIGFPVKLVDAEGGAIPAALDTAGNTDQSKYIGNRFSEVNGKCIDLDGFHDGEVRGNVCENHEAASAYRFGNYGIVMNNSNPDMQSRNVTIAENTIDGTLFGGIFVIGSGNTITGNHLLNLNMAHCPEQAKQFGCFYGKDEPDLLRTGIYLGRGADRPDVARGNVVEDNEITGYGMGRHCIHVAPGVSLDRNRVGRNTCSDDTTMNARDGVDQLAVRRVGGVVEE
ncbi:MAG: right-handed parallel beta-helix repeat-containing protein [Acidobacteriota bacterium]|nr:right-handed parallel beta-helix repeat-containing protein [Acidobacteriota bacterium]